GMNIYYNECGSLACPSSGASSIWLHAGVIIDGNTYLGSSSNLRINCTIEGALYNNGKIHCSSNYITIYKYNNFNSSVNPARYFINDDSSQVAVTNSSGNVVFQTAKTISKPTGLGTTVYKVYNGSAQTYIPSGYDSNTMDYVGTSYTDVNPSPEHYHVYIAPKQGYVWSDTKSYQSLDFYWRITAKELTKPTVKTGSFVYDGTLKTLQLNNYDSSTMNITGNTGTNASTYSATITIKSRNYTWSGGGNCVLSWEITPKPIARPTASNNNVLVYNESSQIYTPDNFNSNSMLITNNQQSQVGKYSATVTPNSNHKWSDGAEREEISFSFEIIHPGIVITENTGYEYCYYEDGYRKSPV
ncbi:MAG: hypothetical protein K2L47_01070, partial [Clostridia bacterium]|nr:hypothetical protein [Clostridia bacterium]